MFLNELIFLLNIILLSCFCVGKTYGLEPKRTCTSLPLKENLLMTCSDEKPDKTSMSCQGMEHEVGTIIKYKCKEYYKPFLDGGTIEDQIECGQNGTWIGVHNYESLDCVEECGIQLRNSKQLVTHGNPTNVWEWPWHAIIFRKFEGSPTLTYTCGGTLIRNSIILTAAHCISFNSGNEEPDVDPKDFKVVLRPSDSNFTSNLESGAQIFNVTKIYVNPHYDPVKDYQADIAILHLSGNVKYTDEVRPACIPDDLVADQAALRPGKLGHIVVFEDVETEGGLPVLKHGPLVLVSNDACFHILKTQHSESQFCASGKTDDELVRVCSGDSGGGLTFLSARDQKFYVRGIVSNANTEEEVCHPHAVFTRVIFFYDWIRDVWENIGVKIRELGSSTPYPYALQGAEDLFSHYTTIPRELEERVTSLELLYVELDPDTFLKSIERSRYIQHLNLSHVQLTSSFPPDQKAYLPSLKRINIDIPSYRWRGEKIEEELIKSFLFFETDYTSQDVVLQDLFNYNIDIELTLGFKRIIETNHAEGRFVLSNVKDCTPIFTSNSSQALSQVFLKFCQLNVSRLIAMKEEFSQLKVLNLNSVHIIEGDVSALVRKFRSLVELVLILGGPGAESIKLSIHDLPPNLKRLSLEGDMSLTLDGSLKIPALPSLETFYCKPCQFSGLTVNRELLADDPTSIPLNIFTALSGDDIENPPGLPQSILLERLETWVLTSTVYFMFAGYERFYTSEDDFLVRGRYTRIERDAYKTGHYNYTSLRSSNQMKEIPFMVQQRLESIEVSNAEISTDVFIASLKNAAGVKVISLDGVSVIGNFDQLVPFSEELRTYKLNRVTNSRKRDDVVSDVYTKSMSKLRTLIPLRADPSSREGAVENVDVYFKELSKTNIELVELQNNGQIILSVYFLAGQVIAQVDFTNELFQLSYFNESTTVAVKVDRKDLEHLRLPKGIKNLVLHVFQRCTIGDDSPLETPVVETLSSLRKLTIAIALSSETLNLSLVQLNSSAPTLTFLSLSHVMLGLSTEIRFTRLSSLFLENVRYAGCLDCFVNNFLNIFPIQELTMVSYSYWPKAVEHGHTNERILWHVFNNNTKELTTITAMLNRNSSSEYQKKIMKFVPYATVIEIGNEKIPDVLAFIIRKEKGKWVNAAPLPLNQSNVFTIFGKLTSTLRGELFGLNILQTRCGPMNITFPVNLLDNNPSFFNDVDV